LSHVEHFTDKRTFLVQQLITKSFFERNTRAACLNSHIQGSSPKMHRILRVLALALTAAFCLGNASQAWAANTITLTVSGLKCSTAAGPGAFQALSWSFGVQGSTETKPSPTLTDLSIIKLFDGCSPALFGAVTAGGKFATVTLVETNSSGGPLLTVTMTAATVTGWFVSASSETPAESISFGFNKVCVEEATSGSTVCYQKR
jgi:type VI protein secretion system component Hcp